MVDFRRPGLLLCGLTLTILWSILLQEFSMNKYITIVFLLMFLGGAEISSAQKTDSSIARSVIFHDIQNGLLAGDVKLFSKHFGRQVSIDLPTDEAGYFSNNQVTYILQNFFGSRRIIQFKFSTIDETELGPFATGGGIFMSRGRRENLQIYVALSQAGNRWVISQFNVY